MLKEIFENHNYLHWTVQIDTSGQPEIFVINKVMKSEFIYSLSIMPSGLHTVKTRK